MIMKRYLLFLLTLTLLFTLCACAAVPAETRQAGRLCQSWSRQTGLACQTAYQTAKRQYTVLVTAPDDSHVRAPVTLLRAMLEHCFAACQPPVLVVIVTIRP